jgi:hypothetical protein
MLMRTAAPKRARVALASFALSAGLLSLSGTATRAQSGPFNALAGSWSGGGTITLSDGSRERLRCRANYSPSGGGNQISLSLRCAGDSYNFEFSGAARYSAGTISGNWSESSMGTSGRFVGRASGDSISARVQGPNFSASLSISTHGNRQAILISAPGSQFSSVSVALSRR